MGWGGWGVTGFIPQTHNVRFEPEREIKKGPDDSQHGLWLSLPLASSLLGSWPDYIKASRCHNWVRWVRLTWRDFQQPPATNLQSDWTSRLTESWLVEFFQRRVGRSGDLAGRDIYSKLSGHEEEILSKMQEKVLFTQRRAAAALCIVLLVLAQQVSGSTYGSY